MYVYMYACVNNNNDVHKYPNKHTQTQTQTNVYLLNNNALQCLLEKAWQSAVFDEFSV